MNVYMGIDLGGTKTIVATFDAEGKELNRVQKPTPINFEENMEMLHSLIAEQLSENEEYKISGIGVSIGGPIDKIEGTVSPLHQPEWRNIPLRKIMEEKWGCPCNFDVDTNAAALAEFHLNSYTERNFLYITLSTGMGGGHLINGKIFDKSAHPEIGHQCINYRIANPIEVQCECGVQDCLEGIISGNGIRRVYGKPAEKLHDQEWDEVAYNLAQGLRNITAMLAPDVIVFGGGVSVGGGEKFLKQAEKYLKENMKLVPTPRLELSRHGYNTALVGAGILARSN